MTIRDQLLTDKIPNKQEAVKMAQKAISSPKAFTALMDCFFDQDYRVAQRAAWIVSHAVLLNDKMIQSYIERMVEYLSEPKTPNTIVRNTLRILRVVEIPEQVQGSLMNTCFVLAEKSDTPVAVKAFSLHILWKLSKIHPDIIPELRMLAELNSINENAAVRNVAEKILR